MIRPPFAIASLWLMLVLLLGSAPFAARQTGRLVIPILKVLMPGATAAQLQAIHMVLRKLTHVVEYAVLALLWYKAVLRLGGRTPRTASRVAFCICLVCAFADEGHQSMVSSRRGSARDFLVDAFAATAMLTIARGRGSGDHDGRLGEVIVAEPAD